MYSYSIHDLRRIVKSLSDFTWTEYYSFSYEISDTEENHVSELKINDHDK